VDAAETGTPGIISWETHSDTWVATDALGRSLPTFAEVGPPRADRFVGIFYFLWLGAHVNGGPYDITRILAQDPQAMQKKDSPLWGPMHAPHHWGESIFGYYLTDDPFVLRKHAQMLADAGIDTLVFDVTNQVTYKHYYLALLRLFTEVRRNGGKTPQVAFLCPFSEPAKVVAELWEDLYGPGLYPDLWFRWEGKPLILADSEKLWPAAQSERIRAFFTFRKPQPDYFRGPTGPDIWSWLEVYPQHVFSNSRGEKEQISVGVAQNAVGKRLGSMSEPGARGRSFHQGVTAQEGEAVQHGFNFAEQFERALSLDPKFIFITGWNEWIAGRFDEFNGVRRPVMFVDEFDQEHSRDIEPMRGGHGDNYYHQMVSFVRRFKGARPPPAARPGKTIDLTGAFAQWNEVQPEFRDDIGDPVQRDHPGYNNCTRYTNRSGRNDLVALKVTYDQSQVYFYARTRDPISSSQDPQWMLLLIDADGDHRTGWEGYDFIVNRVVRGENTTSLERNAGGWKWDLVAELKLAVRANELHLAVPRAALGLPPKKGHFQFELKWADNVPASGDILDFLTHGDTAPNGRFNYRFQGATD
jgi:hypothetical protein